MILLQLSPLYSLYITNNHIIAPPKSLIVYRDLVGYRFYLIVSTIFHHPLISTLLHDNIDKYRINIQYHSSTQSI